jgi:uncharacterized protein (DUF433 family)
MAAVLDYPHITKPLGGTAQLERLPRIRVAMIVDDYLGRGWSAEEIVLHYPHLTLAEVHSALAYYHDHESEIEDERTKDFQDSANAAESHSSPLSRRLKALKKER